MKQIKYIFRVIRFFFIHLFQAFKMFKFRHNYDDYYLIQMMILKLKFMIWSFQNNSDEVKEDLIIRIRLMHKCIMNLKRMLHYSDSCNLPPSLFYSMIGIRDDDGRLRLNKYVNKRFNSAFNEFMKAFKNFPGFWY